MDNSRLARDQKFLERLLRRRPQERSHYAGLLREHARESALETRAEEGLEPGRGAGRDVALETIVDRERPVLFVRDGAIDLDQATILGNEAKELVEKVKNARAVLTPLLPLVGRIDVVNFPGAEFVGTGWFVDHNVVVTNRHVAGLIADAGPGGFVFKRLVGGRTVECSVCNAHEFDDLAPDASRVFKVEKVLYIEPKSSVHDIAFLRIARRTDGTRQPFFQVAQSDAGEDLAVSVIGYPARASRRRIPDQELMNNLFLGRYDVKRVAPGFTAGIEEGSTTHDCTTLGGNSGSVVVDMATGVAVGLHYAGLYEEANFAMRASVLSDYIRRKRWNERIAIEPRPPEAPTPPKPAPQSVAATPPAGSNTVSVTVPVTITVTVGAPGTGAVAQQAEERAVTVERAEAAAIAFWDARPAGVLASRVGFFEDGGLIGDRPCIAASVRPDLLASLTASGPREMQGVPIRYLAATVGEQVEAHPDVEAAGSIAYDDDARTGSEFSFAQVNEEMDVTLHVGPEFSWDELKAFLAGARGSMVSGIYEFHARHIMEAIQERLSSGASLRLVLDDKTMTEAGDSSEEFDRERTFARWERDFAFERILAPKGSRGLIANSYHIKVTVRDDGTFWLSSGNWKASSSQPIITAEERSNATEEDLRGNREWHVVIKNSTLAGRFRSHLDQDFRRSQELREEAPESALDDVFVLVPAEEESLELERRPPSRILEPKRINRRVKVKPLLTPDKEGAVYSEAVLKLIESAQSSLLFQIPYIGMPSHPGQNRGFIDELIKALTRKLKTLTDARVLLRTGSKDLSSPAHAGWFFKSKGVDIDNRLRVIENHHTKGMIVDGKRVLLGSHNWSGSGVTLNRDASLIFDDTEIAGYYAEAFEIDWERANKVRPKQFVREAAEGGFREVRLSELSLDGD